MNEGLVHDLHISLWIIWYTSLQRDVILCQFDRQRYGWQHSLTRDSGGLRIRIPVWSIVIFPINIPLLLVQWTDRLFPAQGWWSFRVRITWEGRNVIVRIFQHCMVAETCTSSSFGRGPDQQFCGRGFKSRSGLSLYLP